MSESVRRKRFFRISAVAAVVVAALLGAGLFSHGESPAYASALVERGDIVKTITATGKTQAVVTVQVGSQVSGRIAALYADYNDRVKKGEIIAKLDPALFKAQLDQARGNLANAQAKLQTAENAVVNAQANVGAAEANREKLRVALQDARNAYNRVNDINKTGAVSAREVEAAQATVGQSQAQLDQAAAQIDQAKAQLLSSRSQVNEARAQVQQMQAAVDMAQANLDYSIIRAPIDGVVIARNVDVGQTVAASLQAPTLFLIANDLTQMQVLADIDEADVGQLGDGTSVTFTVDAYPRDVFRGSVSQVRLNPQTVQNVVTYTAVIDVHNPDLKLKPGMTANVTAIVAESRNVLKVPNAALRFRPASQASGTAGTSRQGARAHVVWKTGEKGELHPVNVTLGVTDGVHTEILSGDLRAGDHVATGEAGSASASAKQTTRNPMMPFGGRPGGRK